MNATDILSRCDNAVSAAGRLVSSAKACMREILGREKIPAAALDREQRAAHALSWYATYAEALQQMANWARELNVAGHFGEIEQHLLHAAFGECLAQMAGGIPMSQSEIVRPGDLGIANQDLAKFWNATHELIHTGTAREVRASIGDFLAAHAGGILFGDPGLDDTLEMVREQFFRFAQEKIAPSAHRWHLDDELIPQHVVDELSALGVFGLTVPDQYGGAGLSKAAMCVVSEELSRAYIGVGSLGTRSEIAAELILNGGTQDQREHWLPRIATGEVLPTAVFTEPNTGSDLGSLQTRALREGDRYKLYGNKTWITHAARADMMTVLARTSADTKGYQGLSMFVAEKARGTNADAFPANGMRGSEIKVLGYRGMKEYEIAFDGFEIPAANLLGRKEGQGFKQLMQTFESARIQTAARAIGVAQSALDLGLRYALERKQFGKLIFAFPRVRDKLAMMTVEIAIARQLTYHAARKKDAGRRCDLEAGMAKLLAARVAWAAADSAVQIHGGNGFALEF